MKKMLTLVLVLAVASLASAAFQIGVTPSGSNYNLTISSDVAIAAGGGNEHYWALLVDAGSVSDALATASQSGAGFDMQINGDVSSAGLGSYGALGSNGTWGTLFTTGGAISSGQLFGGFVVSGAATQVSLVEILPDFSGYGQTLATAPIPEPVTMALLGVGGLFLRRKK